MATLLISLFSLHQSGENLHFVIMTDGFDEGDSVKRLEKLFLKFSSLFAGGDHPFSVEWDFLDVDGIAAEYEEEIATLK